MRYTIHGKEYAMVDRTSTEDPTNELASAPDHLEDAQTVLIKHLAGKYAAELAKGRPGVSPAPTDFHFAFARDVVQKNGFALKWVVNGLNDKAKAVFEDFTGMALPRGIQASWEVIRDWAGISVEQDAVETAKSTLRAHAKFLKSQIGDADFAVVESWVQARIAEGFDNVQHVPGRWHLVNKDGLGFDLSKKGTVLPKARPFIEACCAVHEAEQALVQQKAALKTVVAIPKAEASRKLR